MGERKSENMEIEPENWQAIVVFCALGTQWRTSHQGFFQGLIYSSIETVMRMQRVKDRADVFTRVQTLEQEAMRLMNLKVK